MVIVMMTVVIVYTINIYIDIVSVLISAHIEQFIGLPYAEFFIMINILPLLNTS